MQVGRRCQNEQRLEPRHLQPTLQSHPEHALAWEVFCSCRSPCFPLMHLIMKSEWLLRPLPAPAARLLRHFLQSSTPAFGLKRSVKEGEVSNPIAVYCGCSHLQHYFNCTQRLSLQHLPAYQIIVDLLFSPLLLRCTWGSWSHGGAMSVCQAKTASPSKQAFQARLWMEIADVDMPDEVHGTTSNQPSAYTRQASAMVQGNWLLRQWSLHSARRRTAPVLKKDVYARSNLQSKEESQHNCTICTLAVGKKTDRKHSYPIKPRGRKSGRIHSARIYIHVLGLTVVNLCLFT